MAGVLNVVFGSPDWRARLLSNFAPTSFELWGERFESVEGFWQGLKYPEGSAEQKRVFGLWGYEAKRAGRKAPVGPGGAFTWRGRVYRVGSQEHWDLMRQALRAKFEQCAEARRALLATRGLRLVHELPRDSKTIPGAVFARMLEEIRAELCGRCGP
ncbi:MAG: NADAR family protein [Bacillota bacterium]